MLGSTIERFMKKNPGVISRYRFDGQTYTAILFSGKQIVDSSAARIISAARKEIPLRNQ